MYKNVALRMRIRQLRGGKLQQVEKQTETYIYVRKNLA